MEGKSENKVQIRPLYFADNIFYWSRIGKQATVLEIQCSLTETVDPKALENAFLSALQVHTNFRIRPVIIGFKFQAIVEDLTKVPLFRKDGRKRHLGSAETGGLPLCIEYDAENITLHIFHGISDFRGICSFIHTLLKFYFHELGRFQGELPQPDSSDTMPAFESFISKGAPGAPIGMFLPDENKVFHLPEKNFGKKTTMQKICEIDVPLQDLLLLSKSSESSVMPTLQAFIGRAIRRTYEVGEKLVVCYTPVDLRPIFQYTTGGNGSSNFCVPYSKEMDRYELSDRAMYLRSILDVQIQPENLYARVKGTMERVAPAIRWKIPLGLKTRLIVDAGRKTDRGAYTYGISYAGKVRFDDEIAPCVKSLTGCAGSYSYPLWIVASETNGILQMVLTQAFEDTTLAKAIFQELESQVPGTRYKEWGHHVFGDYTLKSVKRLPVKYQS